MTTFLRHVHFIIFALFASTVLAPHAIAQAGGGVEELFRFDGAASRDHLGYEVAGVDDLDGDGSPDFLIGSPYADPGGKTDAGSAMVYSGASGAVLYQIDGDVAGRRMGYSVSAVGDTDGDGIADFIIGAPGATPNLNPMYGEAYLYSGATGVLLHQFDSLAPYQMYGGSVAGVGDVDGDGAADIIIGARLCNVNFEPYVGSAFVHSGATGALLYRFDGPVSWGEFGGSVDGTGDVNGDGFADFIIGSTGAMRGGIFYSGAAYVYSGFDGALLYDYYGSTPYERLGISVSGVGDVNNDGIDDFACGASGLTVNNVWSAGSAYVYSGFDGTLLYAFYGDTDGGALGNAVSAAGDINGDSHADFLIGAPGERDGNIMVGAAYLYSGANGALLQRIEGSTNSSSMGSAFDSAGDVDGDGRADMLIGTPFANLTGTGSAEGSAFVYRFNPYMESSATAVSVAAGGQVDLELDFPVAAASYGYKVLMSVTGSGPIFAGVDIPLTFDFMVRDTARGVYPFSNYSNLHGTLSANGDASASISIPAGQLSPGLIGRTFWLAAVSSLNSRRPVEYSSVVVAIEVTP